MLIARLLHCESMINIPRYRPLFFCLSGLLIACAVTPLVHANDYDDVTRLTRAGKLNEALAQADQFLIGKPRDPQMRFLKGVAQLDAGKRNESIATFVQLTQDAPELPEPYNNLAVLYAADGQLDKARAVLESAVRLNPDYATAHENLGDIYARMAGSTYATALQLDSGNTRISAKMAVMQTLTGPLPARNANPAAPVVKPGVAVASARSAPVAVAVAAPIAASPAATVAAPVVVPPVTPLAVPPSPAALAAIARLDAASAAKAAKAAKRTSAAVVAPPIAVAPPPIAVAPAAVAVAPAPAMTTSTAVPPVTSTGSEDIPQAAEIVKAVHSWAAAWTAQDMDTYFASYAPGFAPASGQSHEAWEAQQRARIAGKASISVDVQNLVVTFNGAVATARFRQAYRADALKVTSRKTLELVREQGQWRIRKETGGGSAGG